MASRNYSQITEFILVGFSEFTKLHLLFFVTFLVIYVITVLGNVCIILAYIFTASLHSPMYFFLSNFSFLEKCYVSSTLPKMLSNLLTGHRTISRNGCAVQMYAVILLGGTESNMLAAMAYDRYQAICHPLLYGITMNKYRCIQLIVGSWIIGVTNSLVHTTFTFSLDFCDNKIKHFFCDIPPLLKLACADTGKNEIVIFVVGGCVIIGPMVLTLISYIHIISTIVNIPSNSGNRKAFSTCTSHLIVVALFYGSGVVMYFTPKSMGVPYQRGLVSLMYTVIAPLLNPFIYSLRNNDVKVAIRNLAKRTRRPPLS
ncbi:olfactory receptor 1f45-like [Pelodytes ibericus]